MKNLVGSTNPSKETTDSITTHLTAASEAAKPFSVRLTPEERVRTTKFRQGGDRIVDLLAKLATQYALALPGLSVADMLNDMALAGQVRPLSAQARLLADTLDDTELEAESECWWVATAYYSALLRISASDPNLADELRPAVDFFATGRRKKAQPETPTP